MSDIEDAEQDVDPADLVAELDDEPEADEGFDDYDEGELETFQGPARGGPLDGRQIISRYPKGFLLVDMENESAWVYDRRDDGAFYARSADPAKLDDEGLWGAAEGEDYDVLVPDMEDGEEVTT